MDGWGIVAAAGSAAGGTAASAVALRGWWSRREIRQQRAFRRAVEDIVGASMAELLQRQRDFEIRQGRHLDQQDQAIEALRAELRGRGRAARRD